VQGEVETSHDEHCALSETPRLTLGMTEQKTDFRRFIQQRIYKI